MSKQHRDMWLLFAASLIVRLLTIVPIRGPGYMDAAYSYDIALNLAQGGGFVEPFLWNYLDDPAGLPHPSHLYWMPLPSILAWVGLATLGESYRAAQVPFAILSALLPVVGYWVAVHTTGQRRHGWLAGLLTLFSGFYVLYWGHTDNFTPFALAGSLSLIAAWQAGRARSSDRRAVGWALATGALVGLAHLSRADGLLLLIAIGLTWGVALISNRLSPQVARGWRLEATHILFVVLGYVAVMLPWFIRNWNVAGAPLPAGGAQTIWLTTYDDLFSYGRELSLSSYLAWGWSNILRSKLDALWLNLQTLVAVLCMIFLVPLAPIGWWRLRRHPLFQLGAWYALLLFLAMTFVFTFPGPRGGLFHSGGVLLPFIFTAALVGLDILIEWLAAHRRGWDVRLARQVFGIGVVALGLLVSGFLYYQNVISEPHRQEGVVTYARLIEWLKAEGHGDAMVMVGDPPGYWYQGGGPSIVVPNEPAETVLAVADRYGARYLILDQNRPKPLDSLYIGAMTHPRLALTYTFNDEMDRPVHIFHIIAPSE